jgi:hypothetical protein
MTWRRLATPGQCMAMAWRRQADPHNVCILSKLAVPAFVVVEIKSWSGTFAFTVRSDLHICAHNSHTLLCRSDLMVNANGLAAAAMHWQRHPHRACAHTPPFFSSHQLFSLSIIITASAPFPPTSCHPSTHHRQAPSSCQFPSSTGNFRKSQTQSRLAVS